MNNQTIASAATIVGVALAGSLAVATAASAAENPFAAKPRVSGYQQLAEGDKAQGEEANEGSGDKKSTASEGSGKDMREGKCGEGKCGGAK
jgi:uncharacterized low-complexity protein